MNIQSSTCTIISPITAQFLGCSPKNILLSDVVDACKERAEDSGSPVEEGYMDIFELFLAHVRK